MKGILCNTNEVQAILEGRKTVKRLAVKPQPRAVYHDGRVYEDAESAVSFIACEDENGRGYTQDAPYTRGDILYVRETWCQTPNGQYWYRADNQCCGCTEDGRCVPNGVKRHKTCDLCEYEAGYNNIRWKHSIYMPKEAARIFLRVTNVRVERLQDITNQEAWKECRYEERFFKSEEFIGLNKAIFSLLWDSAIKKKERSKYGWKADPYVWRIEFERISREEALK